MRRIFAALLIALTITVGLGATQGADAADPGAQADFVNRINAVRGGGLTPHPVLTAKAEAWAQHMAATGCLCHSHLPDGISVGWRKLGENVGRGPNVAAIHDALVHSPPHYANIVDRQFRWVGVGVAYGGGQMYVAEVFMDGDGPPGPNPMLAFDSRGRGIAARAQGGFWVLAGNGTVHNYEGAPALGSPRFPGDLARDIASMPDGNGYVILDAIGGVHRFGSAVGSLAGVGGPWFGFDIARSISVTPDGRGFAVLDGFGGYHRFGTAPRITGFPFWPGWDIARSLALRPGGGAYLLDGFGVVWARGGAPSFGSPGFGWDIARDITIAPDGQGYLIVDGFGALHSFGSVRRAGGMPWMQVDRWRSIVVQGSSFLSVRNDGLPYRV
jgi:hypothetical protein